MTARLAWIAEPTDGSDFAALAGEHWGGVWSVAVCGHHRRAAVEAGDAVRFRRPAPAEVVGRSCPGCADARALAEAARITGEDVDAIPRRMGWATGPGLIAAMARFSAADAEARRLAANLDVLSGPVPETIH